MAYSDSTCPAPHFLGRMGLAWAAIHDFAEATPENFTQAHYYRLLLYGQFTLLRKWRIRPVLLRPRSQSLNAIYCPTAAELIPGKKGITRVSYNRPYSCRS